MGLTSDLEVVIKGACLVAVLFVSFCPSPGHLFQAGNFVAKSLDFLFPSQLSEGQAQAAQDIIGAWSSRAPGPPQAERRGLKGSLTPLGGGWGSAMTIGG